MYHYVPCIQCPFTWGGGEWVMRSFNAPRLHVRCSRGVFLFLLTSYTTQPYPIFPLKLLTSDPPQLSYPSPSTTSNRHKYNANPKRDNPPNSLPHPSLPI